MVTIKNTLGDLNLHLFEQLERLNDEELTEEKLATEIERSKAMTDVAGKIISNGHLVLKAKRFYDDRMDAGDKIKMLEG